MAQSKKNLPGGDSLVLKEMDELITKIEHHAKKYYNEDAPEIEDHEYDSLVKRLRELEAEYPLFKRSDSPTQKVGGAAQQEFKKYVHTVPMLSLDNCFSEKEFMEFHARMLKLSGGDKIEYICEHKYDGLAMELVYVDGRLAVGATRGDGVIGEDVTENIRTIKLIPQRLDTEKIPPGLKVRGEVVMFKEDLVKLNEAREEEGESLFANPRNAAAGSLRQLDSTVTAGRNLKMFVYGLGNFENLGNAVSDIQTQNDIYLFLKKAGFPVSPNTFVTNDPSEIVAYQKKWEEQRDELKYEIDGVVIKVNSLAEQISIGQLTHAPRWAIAWKFKPRREETTIKDIVIQVGRTGALTPVAILEPVKVGGVVVGRVTLHNKDEVARKDVRIGDRVVVFRSGDVIPKVEKVVLEKRPPKTIPFVMPSKCPVCGSGVSDADGVVTRCMNRMCPAQLKEGIKHFVSKAAMNIDGLGEELVERFVEQGLISDFADIYLLNKENLLTLDRMGEKLADNILSSIEVSKEVPFSRFLFSLGIRYVGERNSRILANNFNSMEELMVADESHLLKISDIGETVAKGVVQYFQQESNKKAIRKLLKYVKPVCLKTEKSLAGLKFVVTGSLKKFARHEIKEYIEQHGGAAGDSVSKNTNFLVLGENPGSKHDKALTLGVPVLTEDEFIRMFQKK